MKTFCYFILAALSVAGTATFAVLNMTLYAVICACVALLTIILAYRAVGLQLRAIGTGMDLLKTQDFASSLRHVGQVEADKVIDLYNSLIVSMKAERLRNREQDKFLGKLVEASPMGIAICDLDGNIEKTNEAFHRLSSPELLAVLNDLDEDSQTIVRPTGAQVLRCSRQYFMDRGFHRSFFLIERLTDEIVRAETDVFHKIVRTMGHEVNNTLGGVVSVLESVAAIHEDDSDVAQVVESCRKSCLHLGEFIRAYSDVVKLPDPSLEDTDLGRFAEDVRPFLSRMCPPNIDFTVEIESTPARVGLDPVLIQRVLINAVKNAVESIGERQGHISLRVDGNSVAVCDDGPGIAPEIAGRLFTPFFSTKQPDRGLGLMLIADILRRHNAAFSLSTVGPETIFLIRFAKA